MLYQLGTILLSLGVCIEATSAAKNGLKVHAASGTYVGIINGTTPNVRQFRSIPYASAPVGERRWLPPGKLTTNGSNIIDATSFPPSCPQYIQSTPNFINQDVLEWQIYIGNQNKSAGASAQETSEDCLHLAVWTPVRSPRKLPVIVFMTGGGLTVGGINIKAQQPHQWVERSQSHIVVTINYRLNIFGFPHAAGLESLESQNLGILDQRAALEWVRDNIAAFGGDSRKITLWGQSAGGVSVDLHNFAFPDDPIANGMFMASGTTFLDLSIRDETYSNFTYVASNLGCGNLTADAELECMRKVPVGDLVNFFGQYNDRNPYNPAAPLAPLLRFGLVPLISDDVLVFSDYQDRYAIGAYSKLPAIISTTSNEGAVLPPYPQLNETLRRAGTLSFLCGAANASIARTRSGTATYRYEFAGNFSNVSPQPWLGAFHDADLAYIFGTYRELRGPPTEPEVQVSEAMQDRILAFMRDPKDGPKTLGWRPYSEGRITQFGHEGLAAQARPAQDIDGPCFVAP